MKSVNEILKAIQQNNFAPIYLLLGKEKFFHDQVSRALSEKLFTDPSSRGLNRIVLHGTENTLSEIVNASLSYPMLSNYKLVIVKEFSKIKTADSEAFLRYLEKPQNSTILLLIADEQARASFFIQTKNKAELIDCKPIPEYNMAHWLKGRMSAGGEKMSSQAITMLTEYAGNSLLNIDNELQKVREYKSDDTEITADEIIAVTGMSKEYNVFTFQKALIGQNLKRSFMIGKKLIESGENLNLVLSVIFNFFRRTMLFAQLKISGMAGAEILKELKINSYQVKDINSTLASFDLQRLEKIIEVIKNFDRMTKSTAQSDWSIIQSLCYNICRK